MSNYAQNRAMQEMDELFDKPGKLDKYWNKFWDKYWDKYGSFANYLKRQLIITPLIMIPIVLSLWNAAWLLLITPIYFIIQLFIIVSRGNEGKWNVFKVLSALILINAMNPLNLYNLYNHFFYVSPW